jgi:hypothetical protein
MGSRVAAVLIALSHPMVPAKKTKAVIKMSRGRVMFRIISLRQEVLDH